MDCNVCFLVDQIEICSTITAWIAVTFCPDIHDPEKKNPQYFADAWTFP